MAMRSGTRNFLIGLLALLTVATAVNLWIAFAARDAAEDPSESDDHAVSDGPPERSVEYVVERTLLERTAIYPAQVKLTEPSTLSVHALGIVTDIWVSADETAALGDPIIGVDGNPVFAMPMQFDLYRDIEPGSSGRDVEELQKALNAVLGSDLAVDGEYGPRTQKAVVKLFERHGMTPDRILQDDLGVPDLAAQVESLNRQLESAREQDPRDEDSEAELNSQLAMARKALSKARSLSGPVLRASNVVAMEAAVPVHRLLVAVGDRIESGPVIETSGEVFSAIVEARQSDVGLLEQGMTVHARNRPDLTFTIASIEPHPELAQEVRITLTPAADTTLTETDSFNVEFVAETTETPVIAVPVGLVFIDVGGNASVLVLEGDEIVTVGVETGLVVDGLAEVLEPSEIPAGTVLLGG